MLPESMPVESKVFIYLDRIAHRALDPEDELAAAAAMAESIETPLFRDMFFSRKPNGYEEQAWVESALFTRTMYATASAMCLAAFHARNEDSKRQYIAEALRVCPAHHLAKLCQQAIDLNATDQMDRAMAAGGAQAYKKYIDKVFDDMTKDDGLTA